MIKNILNLGDAALYCDFGSDVNQEINSNVIKYFYHIKKLNLKGITNLTPSYNKLIISYDLNIHSFLSLKKKIENIEIKENNKLEKNLKIHNCNNQIQLKMIDFKTMYCLFNNSFNNIMYFFIMCF